MVTCVNRRNYSRLPELKEFLYGIGVRNWRLFSIFPAGRAAEFPEFKLAPDQYKGMLRFIKETREEGRIKASYCCEDFVGDFEGEVRDNFFMCQAGIYTGSILLDGSIVSCSAAFRSWDSYSQPPFSAVPLSRTARAIRLVTSVSAGSMSVSSDDPPTEAVISSIAIPGLLHET